MQASSYRRLAGDSPMMNEALIVAIVAELKRETSVSHVALYPALGMGFILIAIVLERVL